jgi:hypothetical protein
MSLVVSWENIETTLMQLPLKIYPSRIRGMLGLLFSAILLVTLIFIHLQLATAIGYLIFALYIVPALGFIGGCKTLLFPNPQIILYQDGLAYPKLGLKKLPWKDIQGASVQEDFQGKLRYYFSPTESDRILKLYVATESPALQQIAPIFRRMIPRPRNQEYTIVPIGLMGASISPRELKKIIDTLVRQQGESQNEVE